MPATSAAPLPVQPASLRWLLLALGMVLLPYLVYLPPLLGVACLGAGLWRWQALQRGWPLPGRVLRLLLTLAALGAVYLSFGTVMGRDAGAALLALMLGLKLLETRQARDAAVVIALAYFLTVTLALFNQSPGLALYQFLVMVMITVSLLQLNRPLAAAPPARALRQAATMMLQALPVMLLLFLLFPRLPGPLWGTAAGGGNGLDDSMSPGSISSLGRSQAVAFRAAFDGPVPDNSLLYWRGPVLWYSDGRSWHAQAPGAASAGVRPGASDGESRDEGPPLLRGEAVSYEVTLQPHGRRWLYALDLPTRIPPGSRRSPDLMLLADKPVDGVMRYRTASHLFYRTAPRLPESVRRRALQLPPRTNPRTRALARRWRAMGLDDQALVQAALRYFNEEAFHYTLQPPLLDGPDPVDQFLFQTRRGFCEHYAAAFTVLMRAAGIPARIVTGYQGGEFNPVGNYLVVRQRDAHAWAEVWLAGEGWRRIDPTAAVAPQRIERGMDSVADSDLEAPLRDGALSPPWQRLRWGLDALDNGWNQWVLGYGHALQQQLLSRWGLGDWPARAAVLGAGLVLILTLLAALLWYRMWSRRRRGGDAVQAAYRRFCRKLARRGLRRRQGEGPRDFADRVMKARPDLATEVEAIRHLYIALRYGATAPPRGLKTLRRHIRRFKP